MMQSDTKSLLFSSCMPIYNVLDTHKTRPVACISLVWHAMLQTELLLWPSVLVVCFVQLRGNRKLLNRALRKAAGGTVTLGTIVQRWSWSLVAWHRIDQWCHWGRDTGDHLLCPSRIPAGCEKRQLQQATLMLRHAICCNSQICRFKGLKTSSEANPEQVAFCTHSV